MKMVLTVSVVLTSPVLANSDPCSQLIPPGLKSQVEQTFHNYRTPMAGDNLPEDIEYNRTQAGTGCLGVAKGDFDGDGHSDTLLALTSREGSGGRVVVAFARASAWELQTLADWPGGRSRLFVETQKPGVFKRTEALAGPLDAGERQSLTCRAAVAVFGATESSAVAYCLIGDTWQHVWISD